MGVKINENEKERGREEEGEERIEPELKGPHESVKPYYKAWA